MKFLPLSEFDDVNSSLNFSTPDCHVVGGCDLYTTKAAGGDKKLYKNIEQELESQYESLVRLSASLSPPAAGLATSLNGGSLDLSRSSPFGPLSEISSRRTFAYLIATLNASHPDYDFSHILRPSDFHRERSLKSVMNTIDSTLYNLRPLPQNGAPAPIASSGVVTPGAHVWGPCMWSILDREMTLKECGVYCWAPEESAWEGEDRAIWSLHYFFFNKERKRVAYLYLRGIPIMTSSPRTLFAKGTRNGLGSEVGAGKRADYWLGSKAGDMDVDEDETPGLAEDEEWDLNDDGDEFISDRDDLFEDDDEMMDDDTTGRGLPRGVSEEAAAQMELDV